MNAWRVGDKKLRSDVLVETMQLLAHSLYGFLISMDRSQHTDTNDLNDGKAHIAKKLQVFQGSELPERKFVQS